MDAFQWSLHEIDHTDIESLIPFVFRYPYWKDKQKGEQGNGRAKVKYADEVGWLG